MISFDNDPIKSKVNINVPRGVATPFIYVAAQPLVNVPCLHTRKFARSKTPNLLVPLSCFFLFKVSLTACSENLIPLCSFYDFLWPAWF